MKKVINFLLTVVLLSLQNSLFALNFSHRIDSDWGDGFCHKFFIKNKENKEIKWWKVEFDLKDVEITSKRNWQFECKNWRCVVKGLILEWSNKSLTKFWTLILW